VIIWTNNGSTASWSSKELLKSNDVVWHASWSLTGNILAISGGDNKVCIIIILWSSHCVSGRQIELHNIE